MLTTKDFIKKCKENETKYYINFDVATMLPVELADTDKNQYYDSILQNPQTKAARLPITLGPVTKNHEIYVKKSLRFKNRKNYQSLLVKREIEIKPNETLSVLSNEYLELDGQTSGLILPRLSLTDIGLTIVPTYIDPYWKGILQMTIINNTNKSINLSVGNTIGVLFLFELSNEAGTAFKDNHHNTSHHYRMCWNKIINTEVEPIPTKLKAQTSSTWEKITQRIKNSQSLIIKSFGAVAILGTIYFLGTALNEISNFKSDLKETAKLASNNKEKLTTTIYTGSEEIVFKKSKKQVIKKVKIDQVIKNNPIVLIKKKYKYRNIFIEGKVTSKVGERAKEITFTAYREEIEPILQSTQFEWVLIP